jgi:NitT/TauT family transport system permease protein
VSASGNKRHIPAALWSIPGIAALLLLWQAAALWWGNDLLLPGPLPVLRYFLRLLSSRRFLLSLGNSFLRVFLGIAVAAPLGVGAGVAAGLNRGAEALFRPFFQVLSATPVMSVILIAFLALGQDKTPVFTAFLMVFPVMAANTMAGVRAIDPKLEELLSVYRLSRKEKLGALYLPGIVPFLLAGLRSALSLCWKVVVAAEVIVQPARALGTGMQNAKARLETAELFAWTAGTVCAAALSQLILDLILALAKRKRGHA